MKTNQSNNSAALISEMQKYYLAQDENALIENSEYFQHYIEKLTLMQREIDKAQNDSLNGNLPQKQSETSLNSPLKEILESYHEQFTEELEKFKTDKPYASELIEKIEILNNSTGNTLQNEINLKNISPISEQKQADENNKKPTLLEMARANKAKSEAKSLQL